MNGFNDEGEKGMRKNIGLFLAAFCISGMLVACGGTENAAETIREESVVSTAEGLGMIEYETAAETGVKATGLLETAAAESPDADQEAMRKAYISILEDLYFRHSFPPPIGSDNGFFDGNDISDNEFAVYDIDQDGKDELIIVYTTTYNGGMTEIIYEFDAETGNITEEFSEYPLVTFYDNGVVEALASHNHGMAGDKSTDEFWPYRFYQYDPESDTYQAAAQVDAWSIGFAEKDWEGNPFPTEIDADGDGMVYYVMPGDQYERNEPMDGGDYQRWRDSYVGEAREIELPLVRLTEENIYGLK